MAIVNVNYNRRLAVLYANRWAYFRNPNFYDFSDVGGDCTNFTSQCLLAGGAVMNYTPDFGWYYVNSEDRAPAWSSVKYFYDFITQNEGVGPYGTEVSAAMVRLGDIVQLITGEEQDFHHTLIVTEINGFIPNINNIYVAAHSYDCACRPLSSYDIKQARFIHINGIRVDTEADRV